MAVEARNLAPVPGDVDFTVGASVAMPGLTAWQGLFEHGRLQAGQSILVHGAAGAVGSMVTQLAREFGAYVIGTGRAADRQKRWSLFFLVIKHLVERSRRILARSVRPASAAVAKARFRGREVTGRAFTLPIQRKIA